MVRTIGLNALKKIEKVGVASQLYVMQLLELN
jgi:hypothetical protein